MKIALCNEVIGTLAFPWQCVLAAALDYDGLEVAPMTLAEEPHRLLPEKRAEVRRAAADAGIAITSLPYILVKPRGLSIASGDPAVRRRTLEVMKAVIELAAGTVAVEPFTYVPDGMGDAARAIGYVREILEALE